MKKSMLVLTVSIFLLMNMKICAKEMILEIPKDEKIYYRDILDLHPEEYSYARNEIYAKKGYIFKTKKYRNYFESKSWYQPDKTFTLSRLTASDVYNIHLIRYIEKRKEWAKDSVKRIKEKKKMRSAVEDYASDIDHFMVFCGELAGDIWYFKYDFRNI